MSPTPTVPSYRLQEREPEINEPPVSRAGAIRPDGSPPGRDADDVSDAAEVAKYLMFDPTTEPGDSYARADVYVEEIR